jgi:hypothetical protein
VGLKDQSRFKIGMPSMNPGGNNSRLSSNRCASTGTMLIGSNYTHSTNTRRWQSEEGRGREREGKAVSWSAPAYVTTHHCSVLCALCSVLCALCSVLCALCSVFCALRSVLCVLCYVLCAMCSVLCALCSALWQSEEGRGRGREDKAVS